jgi:protein-disulfide isomerase
VSTIEDDEQDLTRKQRREQARAQRKQLEEAQATSALRRTRLTQLGIVAAIVVAVIVGIVLATGGGGKKGIETTPAGKTPAAVTEVNSLLAGIPQNANALGSPTAPVTMQYFGDLECPGCREFTLGALKPLVENYVRPGKLRIEYRSFQTATKEGETFRTQQSAALAAGRQQKAWYYIELFYHQQGEEGTGYVTESYLRRLAQQVPGLDLPKWNSDRSNPAFATSLASDAQAANNLGFSGTPAFAIFKTGSGPQKFEPESFTDPASYERAIERLAKA